MTVITISRQYGSGGDEIAARLCKILEYQQFDKSLITRAADEAGISEKEVYDYSEESYKVRTFLDRLFSRAALMAPVPMWEGVAPYTPETTPLSEEVLQALVQKAIRSAYETGKIVILGRGSQVLLQTRPDVLHVRIVAPLEDRIQRLKDELKAKRQTFQADVETRREAQDLILERDAASAEYIKHYYQVDWADTDLYDIVLNTGKLSLERATQIIVDLVTEF